MIRRDQHFRSTPGLQPTFTVKLRQASVAEIAPIWRELEARVGVGHLSCSWEWTRTWLEHYGDLVPHQFAIALHPEPIGIVLVAEGVQQRLGPLPIRTLHLGTAGEPDSETVRIQYNRLLIAEPLQGAFMGAIFDAALTADRRWDEFRLDGFTAEDIDSALPTADPDNVEEIVSHYVDLMAIRESGKSLLDTIGGDRAKKIRRHIRYIQDAHGPLEVQWAESIDEARSIFAEMRTLHQARWQGIGEPGAFASPRFNGFHEDIVERLFPLGKVGLVRVVAGDVTLGCDYTLIEHNRMLGYQWGLGTLEDRRVSVGIVTAAAVMQAALERGIDEYDHLSGDALHKRTLATTSRDLAWARIPSGARIQIIYKLAEARRRARTMRLFRSQVTAQG